MLLAEILGGGLVLALIVYDWRRFSSPTASAVRYGCPVARVADTIAPVPELAARFDPNGRLQLDRGSARWFPDERRLLLHPRAGRVSSRFSTAWPLKGMIELEEGDGRARLRCVKLMPWSSAVLTLLWFAIVGVGTLAFIVRFLVDDSAFTIGSLMLVLGIAAVGLLVLMFGLITFSLAYRLEDQRLMLAYEELRGALTGKAPPAQPEVKRDRK